MIFVINTPTTPNPFINGFAMTTHNVEYCTCLHCRAWNEWSLYNNQIQHINSLTQKQNPGILVNPQGF